MGQFKIGGKVLCVDISAKSGYQVVGIKVGSIYTVIGINTCHCGIVNLLINASSGGGKKCFICDAPALDNAFSVHRFIPIEEDFISSDEFNLVEEKIDIPIKVTQNA